MASRRWLKQPSKGVSGKEDLSDQELGFLHLCAREFYLTGEVVAVPQEARLPAIIYPGQVGLAAIPRNLTEVGSVRR